MKNISNIKDCYGCGLCATVCAKKIIEITLNKDGFCESRITAGTSALEADFGFKPSTSLRDGLRSFAEWYKNYYK